MIGSLFLRSYERSERVYAAMLSRGLDGRMRTTKLVSLRTGDFVAMGVFVVYVLTLASLVVSARGP
jgi:cobalt/nickel transport system permease protein